MGRNWRTREGEIDLVVSRDDLLVFVEVKTWPGGSFELLEKALGEEKQKRIIKTAKRFLAEHREYNDSYIRFDVILVDLFPGEQIRHIENAFPE